jgi:hypothetical protein
MTFARLVLKPENMNFTCQKKLVMQPKFRNNFVAPARQISEKIKEIMDLSECFQ